MRVSGNLFMETLINLHKETRNNTGHQQNKLVKNKRDESQAQEKVNCL
jgi:hypothetical protein